MLLRFGRNLSVRAIVKVANAYAHVALDVVRYGDSDCKPEDRMRHAQAVNIALPTKDLAGRPSCKEANAHEYRIGNVGQREQDRAADRGGAARQQSL